MILRINQMTRTRRKAFTLIELLVVIVILALLLAILVPVLQKAKRQCYQVVCASNLRQTGTNLNLYAEDYKHTLPYMPGITDYAATGPGLYKIQGKELTSLIQGYFDTFAVWQCPAITGVSPMDDPQNTRSMCYTTYFYFPSRE